VLTINRLEPVGSTRAQTAVRHHAMGIIALTIEAGRVRISALFDAQDRPWDGSDRPCVLLVP